MASPSVEMRARAPAAPHVAAEAQRMSATSVVMALERHVVVSTQVSVKSGDVRMRSDGTFRAMSVQSRDGEQPLCTWIV